MRMAIVFLFAVTAEVMAHGGSFGHGPTRGPPPGIGLLCDCAKVECRKCSAGDLELGKRLATRKVTVERHQQSYDFAFVRCTTVFRAKAKRPIEAYAVLSPAAVFAPTGGSILHANTRLTAKRAGAQESRRKYLWAKSRGLDPFLLLRSGPGRYGLRAFPVRDDYDTVVTVEGVVLAPPRVRGSVRLYRTDETWVAVRDLKPDEKPAPAEFHDVEGGRALRFMTTEGVSARYPKLSNSPVRVPFVRELKRAIEGDATALVALPANAMLPPEVGTRRGSSVPPGNREPIDPPPPPPTDPGPPK